MPRNEAELGREAGVLLSAFGAEVRSTEAGFIDRRGGTRSHSGLPDLFVAFREPPVSLEVELKGPKTAIRPSQWREALAADALGRLYVIVRSVDALAVGLWLAGLGIGLPDLGPETDLPVNVRILVEEEAILRRISRAPLGVRREVAFRAERLRAILPPPRGRDPLPSRAEIERRARGGGAPEVGFPGKRTTGRGGGRGKGGL